MNLLHDTLAQLVAFPSISGSDMGALLDWTTAQLAPHASHCQRLPKRITATRRCSSALATARADWYWPDPLTSSPLPDNRGRATPSPCAQKAAATTAVASAT